MVSNKYDSVASLMFAMLTSSVVVLKAILKSASGTIVPTGAAVVEMLVGDTVGGGDAMGGSVIPEPAKDGAAEGATVGSCNATGCTV
mmetsp:Transcript_11012/g.19962  ORF Transcript_11012/g.19962 Transcript_11012/m.19962 type:complete len:87 (+) Transcript_11012:387-647(+)